MSGDDNSNMSDVSKPQLQLFLSQETGSFLTGNCTVTAAAFCETPVNRDKAQKLLFTHVTESLGDLLGLPDSICHATTVHQVMTKD